MRAAWTASGACTSGSTGRREGETSRAALTTRSTGSAVTTSTTTQTRPADNQTRVVGPAAYNVSVGAATVIAAPRPGRQGVDDAAASVVEVHGETGGANARRNDHAALGERGGDGLAVVAGEAGGD